MGRGDWFGRGNLAERNNDQEAKAADDDDEGEHRLFGFEFLALKLVVAVEKRGVPFTLKDSPEMMARDAERGGIRSNTSVFRGTAFRLVFPASLPQHI
jgi:hypothetical protein